MNHAFILSAAASLLAGTLGAADATPKDDITAAAKKLADSANYSWRTTVVVPQDSQFRPGPTEGKTEKDGFTLVKVSFNDNESQLVLKDGKGAAKTPDEGWQTLAELENSEGPARFLGMMARNFKAPPAQISDLVAQAKEIKKEGEAYSSDLTEAGAKTLMTFRRRQGADAPEISNAKGSMKFWLKEGVISKYEFNVKGTVSFNGNDRDVDRTTTVQIKDIGSTKVEVPEEAKKKLS